MDSDTPADRLVLVEPVIENWHCMVVLLKVRYAYNKFYDVLTVHVFVIHLLIQNYYHTKGCLEIIVFNILQRPWYFRPFSNPAWSILYHKEP